MGNKKDPGKFTVRFNIADPQQRAVAQLLNQQGRCKAQFITNAVLFYIRGIPEIQFLPDGAAEQHDDPFAGSEQSIPPAPSQDKTLEDDDLDSIRKTMEAFRFL